VTARTEDRRSRFKSVAQLLYIYLLEYSCSIARLLERRRGALRKGLYEVTVGAKPVWKRNSITLQPEIRAHFRAPTRLRRTTAPTGVLLMQSLPTKPSPSSLSLNFRFTASAFSHTDSPNPQVPHNFADVLNTLAGLRVAGDEYGVPRTFLERLEYKKQCMNSSRGTPVDNCVS